MSLQLCGHCAQAFGARVSHVRASTSGMRSPATLPQRRDDGFIEFVVGEVFVFIKQPFPFPRLVNCATAGLNEGKKLSGEAPSPGFRPWFLLCLAKNLANLSRLKSFDTMQEKRFDIRATEKRDSRLRTTVPAAVPFCHVERQPPVAAGLLLIMSFLDSARNGRN